MPTEEDIFKALEGGKVKLPPLMMRLVEREPQVRGLANTAYRPDALVEAAKGRKRWKFLAELKGISTARAFEDAVNAIRPAAAKCRLNAMVILPYLSPENLSRLEDAGISGLDLCGNGIVTVGDELLIMRTGQPNRFPRSEPIRNVYRGDSSLVCRAFLLKPGYSAVGEIITTIRNGGADISFATVSKVLKTLEADLIVGRTSGEIKLLQPGKLLEVLAANYRPPRIVERYVGKVTLDERLLPRVLTEAAGRTGGKLQMTGAASAGRYAVLAREPVIMAYCTVPPKEALLAVGAPFEETTRFPNVDLAFTDDQLPYFGFIEDSGVKYSGPVQTYLELMSGDKRYRETADQVRDYVLRRVSEYSEG